MNGVNPRIGDVRKPDNQSAAKEVGVGFTFEVFTSNGWKTCVAMDEADARGVFQVETPAPVTHLVADVCTTEQELADALNIPVEALTTPPLGRFGHHPDPANDFCIEVEAIQGQLFDATHGISKPGMEPATIEAVRERIERAMAFRVGGDEIAAAAKQALRQLEAEGNPPPQTRERGQ